MDFYEKNGIIPYINAHDTYTVYGGSRMAENTLQAMKEAAASFVDLKQMQIQLGKKAAELTGNEAAYVTNGAEGALDVYKRQELFNEINFLKWYNMKQ